VGLGGLKVVANRKPISPDQMVKEYFDALSVKDLVKAETFMAKKPTKVFKNPDGSESRYVPSIAAQDFITVKVDRIEEPIVIPEGLSCFVVHGDFELKERADEPAEESKLGTFELKTLFVTVAEDESGESKIYINPAP